MVLEALYPTRLIEKHVGYAFLLGLAYSIIGIGAAVILFPEDPAVIAVAFTALMIYPTITSILRQEEEEELLRENRSVMGYFIHHSTLLKVYVVMFLGILLAFSFFALVLPKLATNYIFQNQLSLMFGGKTGAAVLGTAGNAIFDQALFWRIFLNNFVVMALVLITALIFGDGGIFLIVWNASVWGTIFGNMAKTAALAVGNNPFVYFVLIILSVFPHMILEVISYFVAASVGGISSYTLVRKGIGKDNIKQTLKNLLFITTVAICILLIATAVEVYALKNFEVYRKIINQAFQAAFG